MGQCFGCCKKPSVSTTHGEQDHVNVIKQDKNIDDKRMLKVGIEVLKKDFCVQIGYNRRAVKTYGVPSKVVEQCEETNEIVS